MEERDTIRERYLGRAYGRCLLLFSRVVRVGASASGRAASAERPGASNTAYKTQPTDLSIRHSHSSLHFGTVVPNLPNEAAHYSSTNSVFF